MYIITTEESQCPACKKFGLIRHDTQAINCCGHFECKNCHTILAVGHETGALWNPETGEDYYAD